MEKVMGRANAEAARAKRVPEVVGQVAVVVHNQYQ
jgi:hypothetical protein